MMVLVTAMTTEFSRNVFLSLKGSENERKNKPFLIFASLNLGFDHFIRSESF